MAYFPEVTAPIRYEGPDTKNPLAYRYYRPDRWVLNRKMEDYLKFAVCYWHTMRGTGGDPFGGGVYKRSWWEGGSPLAVAESTCDALFEFISKLGLNYYCFHDRDVAPEGASIPESRENLKRITRRMAERGKETGIKCLWGTANLFSHPRYTHGAATNPDPLVFAWAAAQVKGAMEATHELGGTGYVFWGGREGYSSLLNTDVARERTLLARFFQMAIDYKKEIGFEGMFFIEPKPMEPTTHQYDFDAESTLNFLREFGLIDHFQLNLETNHAWLAGHTFEHELTVAAAAGKLGSLDINRGNPLLGWDTDQFPLNLEVATHTALLLLRSGGLKYGGLNFDAKVRRGSFDGLDLFYAHIGGVDTFARALLVAERIIADGELENFINERYAGYDLTTGQQILEGSVGFAELSRFAELSGEPTLRSGREEHLENLFQRYLWDRRIE